MSGLALNRLACAKVVSSGSSVPSFADGTVVDATNSLTGWTASSGTMSLVTDVATGASCIRHVRTGGNPQITKVLSPAQNWSNVNGLSFWVKWTKPVDGGQDAFLICYVSSGTDINNSWGATPQRLSPGWNYVYIPMGQLPQDGTATYTVGTGLANKSSIQCLGIRYLDAGLPNGSMIEVSDIRVHRATKNIIALTSDDGLLSLKTALDSWSTPLGLPWTHYVVKNWVEGGNGGLCWNLATCQQLAAIGHQISNHSTSHPNMSLGPNNTYAVARSEYETCQSWLRENGFDPYHVAYPFGIGGGTASQGADASNEGNIRQVMSELGIKTARTTDARGDQHQPPVINEANRYQIQTFYPSASTTTSQVTAAYAAAERRGGLLVVTLHGWGASPTGLNVSTPVFKQICYEAFERWKSGVSEVVTMAEAFRLCRAGTLAA